jgi:GNAT superfamily N-acetyltransferase
MLANWMKRDCLCPGDEKSLEGDWSAFDLQRINSAEHPWFDRAYDTLWQEFGKENEMETREVILQRIQRLDGQNSCGWKLSYELLAVTKGETLVAVRDHTVIVPEESTAVASVVHLSHNLVMPNFRRCGIAGWMRSLPVAAARERVGRQGGKIFLACEMEHYTEKDPACLIRLRSYEKAGFRKVDPAVVHYLQPDFRTPEAIEADKNRPVPLVLILRTANEPALDVIRGDELRLIVKALYAMYGCEIESRVLAPCLQSIAMYPVEECQIRLVPPTTPE